MASDCKGRAPDAMAEHQEQLCRGGPPIGGHTIVHPFIFAHLLLKLNSYLYTLQSRELAALCKARLEVFIVQILKFQVVFLFVTLRTLAVQPQA